MVVGDFFLWLGLIFLLTALLYGVWIEILLILAFLSLIFGIKLGKYIIVWEKPHE